MNIGRYQEEIVVVAHGRPRDEPEPAVPRRREVVLQERLLRALERQEAAELAREFEGVSHECVL